MFHGQWYTHGSKTILQETAHSKSLYLLDACDSNPTASIYKKCNIKMLGPNDEELPDDRNPDSNDFHCGYVNLCSWFFFHVKPRSDYSISGLFGTRKGLIFWTFPQPVRFKNWFLISMSPGHVFPVPSKQRKKVSKNWRSHLMGFHSMV